MPQPGQGSFITKRISRKSVTINDIIVDDFERQRHERAQQYYGKKRPAPKVRALSLATMPLPVRLSLRRRRGTATRSCTSTGRAHSPRRLPRSTRPG